MELTDSTTEQLGDTRTAALNEENRSFLGIDLNEIPTGPTLGGGCTGGQEDDGEYEPVEVVRSIHDNPDPAPGAPAEVPEPDRDASCAACGRPESMELVVVCDACERGFHLSCVNDGVEAAPSADWMCSDCVTGGERSKLWPLGVKSKLILDMNASPPSDAEGYGGEETSDSRKHMLASSSFMGNSFDYAMMHSNFSSPGRGLASLEASGLIARNTKMSMDALATHNLGFGFPLSLNNSSLPMRFPSLDPSELFLQNLRHFISERHGVLEDGWRVEFKQPLNGYQLCAVYCAPNGKTFSSIQDVACYLGLAVNGNYSCMDADIRNESSLLQERLHMPKRRKTSRWPNNGFPEQKGSSVSAQLRRFPFNGQTMFPFVVKSGTHLQAGDSLNSGNNGCGCEEANNGLPMQYEDFFVLSLGRIDIRQSYHNVNVIYPIGYKSCWHDKITGSLFTCEVSDGTSGPVFKVTRSPCSKSFIPVGSTVFSCPKIDEMVEQNIDKQSDRRDSTLEHDDDANIETLLSDHSPPLGDDILSCLREKNFSKTFNCLRSEVGSSQVESDKVLSYNQDRGVEIGEIVVEEDSLSAAWNKVSQKLVDACSIVMKQKGTFNFLCKHVDRETREINWDTMNEKDNVFLSLSRFCCTLGPHSVTCGEKDKSEIATLVDALSRWLDQNRFGLDADFVQEMIEHMPGAESCTNYRTLKSRSSSSVPVTVAEGALVVKPKGGENVKEEVFGEISRKSKKPKLNGDFGVRNLHPPPGRPMCLRLPPGLVGDFLQVSEVFWRFHEILGFEEAFSSEKLEQELINPVFDGLFLDKPGKDDKRSEMNFTNKDCSGTEFFSLFDESRQPFPAKNTSASVLKETKAEDSSDFAISYSSHGPCVGALLTRTHISLLQVLICELQSKVAAFVDPNFDSGESRSRRGRKKDDSTLSAKRNKLHMLPVNEFTWPELARRYILSLLSMDGNLESAEISARESGKVFRCLQGDGGLLCGSLTGVAGMEADSMLLAEAIKKISGSLTSEHDVLSVEDDDSDGLDATETNTCNGDIPEWAQVLEPVKKLPTNVGTRIRKCVYEALERNPPEWAKKILEHSISKEVYKGNASGPTKKAVLSLLADVRGGDLVQRSVKGTKKRTSIGVSDVIMKKCRAVLRGVAAADEDKVFCTLLGRKLLNSSDNDDDGLLGTPAMVSRPLDFRTIDLRLAAGAYDGSTEAFLEDVLELWSSIRVMYADQPDYVELVATLSEKFKSLYEAEVLPLVQKLMEYRKLECLSAEMKKEIKDIVVSVNKLPKAPWDEGVCKVCGVDKDDDSVLLCDTCDAEYHTYCLNPPLIRIPEGNWYCPSCVIAKRMAQEALESYKLVRRRKGRKYQGQLTRTSMEMTAHLADVMEEKDYWEFSAEERILLLKLLCDELLSSSLVHQHLEQCAEAIIEMQQKLRSLSSEWKNAKMRQEFLTAKLAKVEPSILKEVGEPHNSGHFADQMGCDQRPQEGVGDGVTHDDSSTAYLNKNKGKAPLETDSQPGEFQDSQPGESHVNFESKISSPETISSPGRHEKPIADTSPHVTDNPSFEKYTSETLHKSVGRNHETHSLNSNAVEIPTAHDASSQASQELQACLQDLNATSHEIHNLQQSIRSIESQLLKQSIRRDFLGNDASGRLYWGCCFPDENPRILVDGSISLQKPVQADLMGSKVPSPFLHAVDHGRLRLSPWTYYETETEISELVQWLHDDDLKERDLRESILCWKRLRFGDVQKEKKQAQNLSAPILARGLETKAAMSMEKKYGPCIKLETETLKKRGKKTKVSQREKLCRCECLESILPSMIHCLICHKTFASDDEFEEHTESKCIPYSLATEESKEISDSSKAKESLKSDYLNVKSSAGKAVGEISNVSELDSGLIRYQEEESISPYHFEEICSKFVTKDSNRDLVKEIGLIGSNGIPTFLPASSTHHNDSVLINANPNKLDGGDSGDQVIFAGPETNVEGLNSESNLSFDGSVTDNHGGPLNKLTGLGFGFSEQKNKKSSGSGLKSCCVVPQAALKRITGKALPVFRFLKTNLLDMDVALPEEALRPSKSHPDRRRAWRVFVKSAQSIYELVQATFVVEDMIKTEYLKNEWWYWSSLSAAAKISTLSALSVRIFSLDAAIIYDKPITPSDHNDETKPIISSPDQKSQPVSDSQEKSSRVNRRSGKKRKEPEGS
ncbi:methyl-CpG-binding domain 9 [Arabidopsis lyrata subsp. lyrata]|uniref:Methyl-CpG-binding domain 9 n=1 Tax=Arabidopsis lyrata subsp. lyrata TaxID=81972 RepID=D7L9P7_ARALL|nr:methyl-CpG-binding domain-containing protein 9 [Arabidopsis lyrata subsp. lyrata]EFH60538.1 methyl-CpG-binding domain 9 [Arabidopsis lyrata subsp. lyrata]|eukprot:XP_002884279.1 methyl-CpG-binding domain-containing protein 9 [Arabidopsis lyrata subsp. lyrata]